MNYRVLFKIQYNVVKILLKEEIKVELANLYCPKLAPVNELFFSKLADNFKGIY